MSARLLPLAPHLMLATAPAAPQEERAALEAQVEAELAAEAAEQEAARRAKEAELAAKEAELAAMEERRKQEVRAAAGARI